LGGIKFVFVAVGVGGIVVGAVVGVVQSVLFWEGLVGDFCQKKLRGSREERGEIGSN
jgi:hypothetical protein